MEAYLKACSCLTWLIIYCQHGPFPAPALQCKLDWQPFTPFVPGNNEINRYLSINVANWQMILLLVMCFRNVLQGYSCCLVFWVFLQSGLPLLKYKHICFHTKKMKQIDATWKNIQNAKQHEYGCTSISCLFYVENILKR